MNLKSGVNQKVGIGTHFYDEYTVGLMLEYVSCFSFFVGAQNDKRSRCSNTGPEGGGAAVPEMCVWGGGVCSGGRLSQFF